MASGGGGGGSGIANLAAGDINTLMALGFDRQSVEDALTTAGGNIEMAGMLLYRTVPITNSSAAGSAAAAATPVSSPDTNTSNSGDALPVIRFDNEYKPEDDGPPIDDGDGDATAAAEAEATRVMAQQQMIDRAKAQVAEETAAAAAAAAGGGGGASGGGTAPANNKSSK